MVEKIQSTINKQFLTETLAVIIITVTGNNTCNINSHGWYIFRGNCI